MEKAIVRQRVERLECVSRTWFECESGKFGLEKTLVVEVDFDTDPNSPNCRPNALDAIEETVKTVLTEQTTMIVSNLRIVPRDR